MTNYSNGKIYKIVGGDECYIGSTTKARLCQRMTAHRSDYLKWKNGERHFVSSYHLFDKYGVENCVIELIELYPCNSKDELNAREGMYIKSETCVNRNIAGRSIQAYYQDNKEKLKDYQKQHYEQNKETVLEVQRTYYQNNKEKIKDYQKQHTEQNKETVQATNRISSKKYRDLNKDAILEKSKLKYTCECGSHIRIRDKSHHNKTQKHTAFIFPE
jgi:hypothetical protein